MAIPVAALIEEISFERTTEPTIDATIERARELANPHKKDISDPQMLEVYFHLF